MCTDASPNEPVPHTPLAQLGALHSERCGWGCCRAAGRTQVALQGARSCATASRTETQPSPDEAPGKC